MKLSVPITYSQISRESDPASWGPLPVQEAPAADLFPEYPASWYYFCDSSELQRGPVGRDLFGTRLVGWRTESGRAVVMAGLCSHFGADLAQGEVCGDRLRCAFHHWEFGPGGKCEHLPAQSEIPSTARQRVWPTVERHGFVFVFNGLRPRFELPFFPDCDPDQFLPARPFGTTLDCPWFLIGANAFDLQHFRAAHDRRMIGSPQVREVPPFARWASGTYAIAGSGLQDRVTRLFAGEQVRMSITDWCGNLMFATAEFRRTISYGMVITEPLPGRKVTVRVIAFLPCSEGPVGRLFDPLRRALRRFFIRRFLSADASRLNGTRYHPGGLIAADRDLVEYLCWLSIVSQAGSSSE